MDIYQEQSRDNVRFIYNLTPNSRVQQGRSVIHPAFHYNLLGGPKYQPLKYCPLVCKCQAVMNKFCPVDFNMKTITCCICGQTSALQQNYAAYITPQKLPYELLPSNSTFEYQLTQNNLGEHCPAYIFVIDICIAEKQLISIQQELIKAIKSFPNNTRVGLITFNKFVYVYELASKLNTIFCINGSKQYKVSNIMEILGVNIKNDPRLQSPAILNRFLIKLEDCRQKIIKRIQDIKIDPFIYVNQRPYRAIGQALNVAMAIDEVSPILARVIMLIGGPCTHGPGQVISPNYKQQMRSALQLSKGENIPHFVAAKKFYESLSLRVLSKKIIIDMFAFCVQEVGLMEMGDLLNISGGFIVMHQQFKDRIFKESFQKLFSYHIPKEKEEDQDTRIHLFSEGTLTVYASKQIAINGALGQCHPLGKMKPFVSDKQIGKGQTHVWYLGSVDKLKTITILYESKQTTVKNQKFYIQLKTNYKDENGFYTTRITTLQRSWGDNIQYIAANFDQEAAAVFLARLSMHKALVQQQKNLRQWLDACLCRWATYYANYIKSDHSSFSLPPTMKHMPQYIYHMRRSHFINRFGCSLDESYYHSHLLGRESIQNCISMIQPALLKYSLESSQPEAVPLDEQQMKEDVILLLDSYFNIAQWYGQHIQSWWENKYHEQEGYQHIAELLQSPKQDIKYIMSTRFPAPNYYLVYPGHSKQRYLKSRVNPKKSQGVENQNMLTDDSDLKSFTQHLIKVVVNQTVS